MCVCVCPAILYSTVCVQKLDSVLKLELVVDKSPEEITTVCVQWLCVCVSSIAADMGRISQDQRLRWFCTSITQVREHAH